MAEGWRDWLSAWESFRVAQVDEYRELDGERVIVLHRFSGRAATTWRMRGRSGAWIRGVD
jgi:hypothetical protein